MSFLERARDCRDIEMCWFIFERRACNSMPLLALATFVLSYGFSLAASLVWDPIVALGCSAVPQKTTAGATIAFLTLLSE